MEPTTQNNKKIILIVVVVLIILAIIAAVLIIRPDKDVAPIEEPVAEQEKNIVPTTVVTQGESDEMKKYIDEATTFDNEASLKEIEKEF